MLLARRHATSNGVALMKTPALAVKHRAQRINPCSPEKQQRGGLIVYTPASFIDVSKFFYHPVDSCRVVDTCARRLLTSPAI